MDVLPNGKRVVRKGGMLKHQLAAWDLQTFIKGLLGGYGSGKSKWLGKRCISSALTNAPAWVGLVSPTYVMAKRTVIPTVVDLLDGKSTLRPDITYEHNKSDHVITIKTENRPDATIVYMSAEDPDSMKGPNLAALYMDEPFLMEKEAFEVGVSRCRDPRSRLTEICFSGTPEELNWGYELCEGELRSNYDVGYVVADTRDNITLDPQYAERMLKGFDPLAAQAYVGGKFVNLAKGRVYYAFNRAVNVKEVPEPPSGLPWLSGMDFNVNPMAFGVGWKTDRGIHIAYEYELPNSDTAYAAATIKDHHPQVKMVYPDPSGRNRSTKAPAGQSDFTLLRASGFIVMAPHEAWSLRDSYNSVNMLLADGRLTIHPRCKKLIYYFEQHSHEKMNKQEEMTHLLDGVRYACTYIYPAYRHGAGAAKLVGL